MRTPPDSRCRLCHGSTLRRLRTFVVDSSDGQNLELCTCRVCSALALEPQPSETLLQAQYAEYFERRSRTDPRSKVSYFRWLLARLDLPLDGARIFEPGAGEGNLVRALNAVYATADVTVAEPLWRDSDASDLRVRVVPESFDAFVKSYEGARFNFIFMLDFLEHVRDPLAVLAAANDLLAPGGKIIVTTPNADAFGRRLFGVLWPQYKVEHLFYFSRASLVSMAAEVGLRIDVLSTHVKRLPVGYLLNVGSAFGPQLFQRASRRLASALGPSFTDVNVVAPFGEWLCVLERPRDDVPL